MEHRLFRLQLQNIKQETVNDQNIGIFTGLASTFEVDSEQDQIMPGTFSKALQSLKEAGKRQIQMKFLHFRDEIIGGFPVDKAVENSDGFLVEGNVNLDVQRGKEVFALMKQGVISDMSIGFFIKNSTIDEELRIRKIDEIRLVEISLVDLPANPGANVLEVKTVTPFLDLPLADQDRPWDSDAAVQRVRAFTDSQDEPSRDYRRAFMWFDGDDAENFGAYKLPYADVINGRLMAVPRALFAIRGVLSGARGGVDIPEADQTRIKRNVNRYFRKMDLDPPFDVRGLDLTDVKSLRDVNDLLKRVGLSNKEANKVISIVKSGPDRDDLKLDESSILSKMNLLSAELNLNQTLRKLG